MITQETSRVRDIVKGCKAIDSIVHNARQIKECVDEHGIPGHLTCTRRSSSILGCLERLENVAAQLHLPSALEDIEKGEKMLRGEHGCAEGGALVDQRGQQSLELDLDALGQFLEKCCGRAGRGSAVGRPSQ